MNAEIRTAFRGFIEDYSRIYSPDEIDEVISRTRHYYRIKNKIEYDQNERKMKLVKYFEVPCAFDIETSSFYIDGHKYANMYVWMLGIFGLVVIGRTWDEFVRTLNRVSEILQLNPNKRIICGVQNLAYEFQFMRCWFEWTRVFALKSRTPVSAVTSTGIEFRCTYLLSGYSLEKIAEHIHSFDIRKHVGDLDYTLVRHSTTPLTDEEIGYCVDDVKIVMADLYERIQESGGIHKIPLTKTGYVREFVRGECFGANNGKKKTEF